MNKDIKKEDILMNKKPTINRYISKEGFENKVPIRGIHEIRHLFPTLLSHNCFICGGYARYCMSSRRDPIPAKDIDIYTGNNENFHKLHTHFCNNENLTIRHENQISITYNRPTTTKFAYHPEIQIIKPLEKGRIVTLFDNDIIKVLNSFDFTIIRTALIGPYSGIVDADFDHDEEKKIIRIKNIHCPVSSTLRCMKYSKKGYYLPPTETLKLLVDWEHRDSEYKSKILTFVEKLNAKNITQEEIDELEEMLNVD